MFIRVNDITDMARRLTAMEQVDEHPTLVELQEEGLCTFLAPIALDFTAVREYDHIRVEGIVSTRVRLDCSRCLTPYETGVSSSFTIFYTRASAQLRQDEEVELGERELVSATYDGDEIDLSSEIAEHVIMELPLKPLCRDECRGLCGSCGVDLNVAECHCTKGTTSLAFSALKDFKLDR